MTEKKLKKLATIVAFAIIVLTSVCVVWNVHRTVSDMHAMNEWIDFWYGTEYEGVLRDDNRFDDRIEFEVCTGECHVAMANIKRDNPYRPY